MKWLDRITNSMDMNLSKLWEIVKDRGTWWVTVYGMAKSWTRLSDSTATNQVANRWLGFYVQKRF